MVAMMGGRRGVGVERRGRGGRIGRGRSRKHVGRREEVEDVGAMLRNVSEGVVIELVVGGSHDYRGG